MSRYIYHIRTRVGIKKVVGERIKIPGLEEFHFFAHKTDVYDIKIHGFPWSLSEYNTGMGVASHRYKKELPFVLLQKRLGNLAAIKATIQKGIENQDEFMPERISVKDREEVNDV